MRSTAGTRRRTSPTPHHDHLNKTLPGECAAGGGGMLATMDQERYQLVDVIGSGGMATVWRAHDTRLGRVVAIKRPHPAPADSTTLPRFAREARAAATVSHPNLVSVYDVGEDDTGPFLVMEFVDGPSLATTTVPQDGVAVLGVQIASALGALHAAGIVHGDVKPANILVSGDQVKLTDFGIARTGSDTSALTREGVVFATPEYAAPETLATGVRTTAGDVYALGAVLHELLTGTRWNPTTAATATLPPAAWLPVLSAALARDPEIRPTADELGADLARLQHGDLPLTETLPPVPPPIAPPAPTLVSTVPAGHRNNGRTAAAIFAGAVVALAALVGFIALTSDGGDDAAMDPATSLSSAPANTAAVPQESAPPPTELPATNTQTAAPTTIGPQTTTPATTISPARELGQDLADLVAQEVENGLDRDDAVDIVDDLNAALLSAEAGQTDDALRSLRDVQRRIDRQFDDDTRDDALDLLAAFAAELGVDPDEISPPRRDDDDDD